MTITLKVQQKFFMAPEALIRLPPTVATSYAVLASSKPARSTRASRPRRRTNLWTIEEHDRFLRGLEQFPRGPWKEIAAIVGTKTTRQTMTHAQKYREKIERRRRSGAAATEVGHNQRQSEAVAEHHSARGVESTSAPDQWALDCASIDQALRDAASPFDASTDFLLPSIFDQDLSAFIEDLDHVAPALSASMALSYAF